MMRRLRQRVVWIVGTWLLCQAFAMILVPVALCGDAGRAAAGQACVCAHAAGSECPMHHAKPASPSACSCRSTSDLPAATLVSLIGSVAVLTQSTTVVAAATVSAFWPDRDVRLFDATIHPDPPPPRA